MFLHPFWNNNEFSLWVFLLPWLNKKLLTQQKPLWWLLKWYFLFVNVLLNRLFPFFSSILSVFFKPFNYINYFWIPLGPCLEKRTFWALHILKTKCKLRAYFFFFLYCYEHIKHDALIMPKHDIYSNFEEDFSKVTLLHQFDIMIIIMMSTEMVSIDLNCFHKLFLKLWILVWTT